ncbi:Terminal nucleotidyltransferase 4B [Coccomyxa sp. Obi]|nr:Terminal nucleotidyltransferase 4B [Coccomyxa sp. Obi]
MEGIKFQYNTLAALGGGILGKPGDADHINSAQLALVDPVSSAAAPVGEDCEVAQTAEDNLQDEFIGFTDEPVGEEEDEVSARPGGSPKAAEEPSTSGRSELPWTRASHRIRSATIRLHNELVEFCRFLAPSSSELEARKAALARVTEAVQSIWPSATVQVFGSFVTGLYLPSSDMDIVVMDSKCGEIRPALKAVATALVRRNMAKNIQIIAKAKVPIIKFEDTQSGINFDISFDAANGPEAAEYVRALMQKLPPMRPLVLILKVFLHQRELNEVYQGGIGSYALLVMVAAFLLLHPSRGGPGGDVDLEANLGVLLMDFLRLYGRSLNTIDVGVSCRKGGCYFPKRSRGMLQPERPYMLAVEDPKDPSNDLGKGSYNIQKVRSAFDFAYQQLTAPADEGESLLQRVVRLDAAMMERRGPTPPRWPTPEPPARHRAGAKRHRPDRDTAADRPEEDDAHAHRRKRRKHTGTPEEDDSQKPRKGSKKSKQTTEAMWERKAKRRKRSRSLEGEDRKSAKPKKAKKMRERDTAFGSCESGELVEERPRRSASHVRFSDDE